ncbi:hypothetical protein A6C57_00970 [Fibrella sp. ES10-3-2-2]|nr:hypothetical protein A6C57_00970 [Fibrella sp. ES10-3-2-2]
MNSRFEQFLASPETNENFRADLKGNGSFEYAKQVKQLVKLSNNANLRLMIYLFGEQLGYHMAEKYLDTGRDLLAFFGGIDDEHLLFILHELKTNESLFAYC